MAAPLTTIAAPFSQSSATNPPFLTGIALANDGYGVVTASDVGLDSGDVTPYLYASAAAQLLAWTPSLSYYTLPSAGIPALTASADGSVILAWDSIGDQPVMVQYSPETMCSPAPTCLSTRWPIMQSSRMAPRPGG